MKRFPELARRGVALALAASMSLSILAPGALAASASVEHIHPPTAVENSVDELGNVDLSDEVYDVPEDETTIAAPAEDEATDEDTGLPDDLTEEQLAEQALVDESGHKEHTPDTEKLVFEQPSTCTGRGYAIYFCSFELKEEDVTVAHCYHQVIVWLPLADHAWGGWQDAADADSQKYRVCEVCGAVEYEDGTVVTPGGIPVVDPDHPEWIPPEVSVGGDHDDEIAVQGLHKHNMGGWETTVQPGCTTWGQKERKCKQYWFCGKKDTESIQPLGHTTHVWKVTKAATCTQDGVESFVCSRCGGDVTDTRAIPATGHDYQWVVTTPATCTEAGVMSYKCTKCNDVVGTKAIDALGHDFDEEAIAALKPCQTKTFTCRRDGCNATYTKEATAEHTPGEWEVIKEPACTENGIRVKYCTVCGEEVERDTTSDAVKALGHDWGEWVDDNQPGCLQQTATRTCKRNGEKEHTNLRNFDTFGKHKFTHYTNHTTYQLATCDYGCGTEDKISIKHFGSYTNVGLANMAAGELKTTVRNVINDTLRATQADVNAAQTKEEAIAALLGFKENAANALVDRVKISVGGKDFGISKKDALDLLNSAIPDLDSVGESLNDSFLSKETIQAVVNKLASAVTGDAGSKVTEDVAFEILYKAVYDYLEDTKSDYTAPVENLLARYVSIMAGEDYGWDALTRSLVKDAVKLGVGKLKEKEKYAKLLETNLGVETLKEVEDAINQQLVNDPTFMKQVRDLLKNAANNASNGISRGWSDERVLTDLRTDVMPVTELVANKISELGGVASDIADKKVNDTVKKYLPGKLGDWVSDKLGGYIKGQVQNEVDGVGEDVNDLITSYIKYLTCPSHHEATRIVQAQTCTTPKKTETYCTECDWVFKKEETAPALGHDPMLVPGVEPTQDMDGLTDGVQCARCGAWLEPQEVLPALQPRTDKWLVTSAVTTENIRAAGYENQQKLDAAINAVLTKAGFDAASSTRFFAQVNSTIGILPNDRYPEEGVAGMVKQPEATRNKNCTFYAVQVLTADSHGHNAGDVVVTPLTVTKEGISLTLCTEAVVAIAWKVNE